MPQAERTGQVPNLHEEVVRANVDFYKQIAPIYDNYETCVSDPLRQEMLNGDLTRISSSLSPSSRRVSCLDCGGGTGNLALKMARRGWDVTVVDVSQDMLAILRAKAERLACRIELVNDSVETFLAQTDQMFQVVSFSSVLHHLYSPVHVVAMAAKRVAPGGFFYSNFDPVKPRRPHLAAVFLNCDTILAKVAYDRKDFFPGIARRMRKLVVRRDPLANRSVASVGDLAEFHANEGLDFEQIRDALKKEGFNVEVGFYPGGRTRIAQWVNARVEASMRFKIIAQRQTRQEQGESS